MDRQIEKRANDALLHALHPIRQYLDDPMVQEVEINGENDVWVERAGAQSRVEVQISETQIRSAITLLARLDNKDAKAGTVDGIIDAKMDGFRVAAALPPTSVRG